MGDIFKLNSSLTQHNLFHSLKESIMIIATKRFTLPVGYQYQISNPVLWYTSATSKGVYRPITPYISGTIASGRNEDTAHYEKAVIQPFRNKYAEVYAIDDAEQKGDGKVVFK